MSTYNLSKSSFAAGRQCHKRLWIEKKAPDLVPEVSVAQQAIFDQGHEVGDWSHQLFPGGLLLSGELDFATHLQASREALASRQPLFEPAFSIPGAYARADILAPAGTSAWDLLEVKSASNVWESSGKIKAVYLQDIAYQLYVYRAAGLEIHRAYLVFLNSGYVRHGEMDPGQLFRREDVTAQVEALLPLIPGQIAELATVLQRADVPATEIGPHCNAPYECSLKSHCWKEVPEESIFTLARGGAKIWRWWNQGIIRLVDLPATEKVTASQSVQIDAARTQEMHVDVPAVRQFVGGLIYPLSLLDFETVMPAVPLYDGTKPYGQVPFQFSLHVQDSPGADCTHRAYLDPGQGDPRVGFLTALQAGLGPAGSIVCYNSNFEMTCLKALAVQFPGYAAWIESILPRFIDADLWKPFRNFSVYHPSQLGSASIKDVLPAFTNLGYDDLAIQEGGSASNRYLGLLKGLVPAPEIAALRENLLQYCERDTWAMVVLLEKLRHLVGLGSPNFAEEVTLMEEPKVRGSNSPEIPAVPNRSERVTAVSTPQGQVTLIAPTTELLRDIRRFLPFGAVRYLPPQHNADFGLVMQCDDREVLAVKQQPVDCDEQQGFVTYQANCILIAHSLTGYLANGYSGLLMPSPYIRKKEGGLVESGIAYIGGPCPEGVERLDRPFEPAFDSLLGHGFTSMMMSFIVALQESVRETGIGLATCIGLDPRPRSHLQTLGFGFLVVGSRIVCVKTVVSDKDPVWTILRATGITEVYHAPSVPAQIEIGDLPIAKPSFN